MQTHAGLMVPRSTSSVPAARAFAAVALDAWGLNESVVDDASLLLTEVAANAIRHVDHGDLLITFLVHDDRLMVTVHDRSAQLPVARVVDDEAESGRGLVLVEALATRWGSTASPTGKAVWFELAA